MTTERELLSCYLRELLELVENPETDLSKLRPWLRYEICTLLSHIERQFSTIEPQHSAFAEDSNKNSILRLLTGKKGHLNQDRKHITDWLVGAKELTVVDPYFFSFSQQNKIFHSQEKYVAWLIDLIPMGLENLEVFHLPRCNKDILDRIKDNCKRKSVALQAWETTEIHDRVLIRNGEEAKVVGTSFNGLGNKFSFVLDLPAEDLEVFRCELHRIKVG